MTQPLEGPNHALLVGRLLGLLLRKDISHLIAAPYIVVPEMVHEGIFGRSMLITLPSGTWRITVDPVAVLDP